MSKLQFSFTELESDSSCNQFATSLGGKFLNGLIQVPAANGTGIIRKIKFEEGLTMHTWDFRLNKDIEFFKSPEQTNSSEKKFYIAYILSHSGLFVKNGTFPGM